MAWDKCWSSPTERAHSGPRCSGLGSRPTLFLFWLQWQAYVLSVAQIGSAFFILFAILFSILHLHTNIQRSTAFNQRKTDSSTKKALQSCWSHCTVQYILDDKTRPHLFTGAASALFGKMMMTKQGFRMTQSLLVVGAIKIWRILNALQWSSQIKLLPRLFWGSLGWPTLITHGQSGHCSWLIQQIIMHNRKNTF